MTSEAGGGGSVCSSGHRGSVSVRVAVMLTGAIRGGGGMDRK